MQDISSVFSDVLILDSIYKMNISLRGKDVLKQVLFQPILHYHGFVQS